jgi:hypothetical protein
MKKIIISAVVVFIFCANSFANTNEVKIERELPKKAEVSKKVTTPSKKDKPICRVSCSVSWSGPSGETVTVSAEAGSIFTSCETAISRCLAKLENAMVDLE